jgi:hypothetical protein
MNIILLTHLHSARKNTMFMSSKSITLVTSNASNVVEI